MERDFAPEQPPVTNYVEPPPRLWHNNKILKKIPELTNDPVINLINQGIGFATAYISQNDIYMIWVIVLLIAYENVANISSSSLLEEASTRSSREYVFLYNCGLAGYLIIKYKGSGEFYRALLVLWSLVIAKFLIRIVNYMLAQRAYGLENANLVSDYMKSEHKLTNSSDAIDPISMKGYKYLVMGEEKVDAKAEAPDYTAEVELKPHVVTVEKVWDCKERLLHPSVDKNGSLKDVCLSFALFKLLRRRYFGYPAAEAQGDQKLKTRRFLLEGLLCAKATGVDTEEVDKERVIATFCYPRFSISVNNTLGQYSLVTNCNKNSLKRSQGIWLFISTCGVQKSRSRPPGLKGSKAVELSKHVKNAIFDTLLRSRGELTNGKATLQRYGQSLYHDLQSTLNPATPIHTIMMWHIATSFCAIHPVKEGGNKMSIKPDLTVATHLSNYCAYLVAFHPDLLPLTTTYSVKHMLWKVFEETCEFFGRERKLEAKYERMMSCRDDDGKIIHRGAALGRYLHENIKDDTQRWKMLADFWSEYILFIAPSGSTRAHIQELGNGSEYITHLWALLYHGGIIDTSSAEYHPL
ncbi:hypothetical protein LUZ62_065027 [Rhynchospora pubera]|uniref:DUF4220 domain-containing protein n=1 Tax=Rhynchospora pubera TaxID=906938 RepID=A0AAV8EH83_9POAL|nr:hypothetical protein LUZ62_065027 [Rhynchospora pubera]